MSTLSVLDMVRARTLEYILVSRPTSLIDLRVVILVPEPGIGVSYQFRVLPIRSLSSSMILIMVLTLAIATLYFHRFLWILCFVRCSMLVSTCHDFSYDNCHTLVHTFLHTP